MSIMSHIVKGSASDYNPASWHSVPFEIKESIMSHVFRGRGPFAALATVSQEWRDLVEPYIFSRITLTRCRLLDFERMTGRNRGYVRHLWLSLELQPYACLQCVDSDDEFEEDFEADEFASSPKDTKAIQKAFEVLFKVLSSWPPTGKLVLDISAYSETDRQHGFKYLTFEPDWKGNDPAWHCRGRRLIQGASPHDRPTPCETWIPSFHELHKVFSDIHQRWPSEEWRWRARLRNAPAVTTIMIRQQNRRRWNPEILQQLILNCPRLEEFYYEPWREWNNAVQEDSTDAAQNVLFRSLPSLLPSLRKLVVFENFSEIYALTRFCDLDRSVHPQRRDPLAKASLSLEEFSASFLRDARYFFANLDESWSWPHLTRFAMTSKWLDEEEDPKQIEELLISAATAAKRMPSLRVMEIWNGGVYNAMVFRYELSPDYRSVTVLCRGTWLLQISPDVQHMWNTVARQQRWMPEVTFRQEVIDPDTITSHAHAISRLKLDNQVMRPISLQQVHVETLQRCKLLNRDLWQRFAARLGPFLAARRASANSLPATSTESPVAGSGTAAPLSPRPSKRPRRHSY
ncbi:uncharacterized protein BBA_01000 [Beauveria bassiana ARSEF 2860]|uniref:DUF6546 domain-containing protein n=1 Tax=Beauveria bassiana (strain ARSEF 2860) TaxID=655819 RepID=J5K7N4_BEAB2|nr:uncharacterized protein BBA_01000 [Beauveria bassiana ARSEF 2860]EJP70131.1 hypothetical protein BBA_01000 [Beauveria bassiana ARSEF 2860]